MKEQTFDYRHVIPVISDGLTDRPFPFLCRTHTCVIRFVFQLNLIWSDHSQSTSYRSYSEFFDFQCDLLAQFPREAGSVKGHERIIPYLPGKKVFQRSDRRLAESRLAQIDCYMREFVQLPDHVVKCESACRFFRSNWPEDKAKNGENAPLVSNVRYTVRTMSRDHLLDAEDGSREGSVDPLSPTHSDSP